MLSGSQLELLVRVPVWRDALTILRAPNLHPPFGSKKLIIVGRHIASSVEVEDCLCELLERALRFCIGIKPSRTTTARIDLGGKTQRFGA